MEMYVQQFRHHRSTGDLNEDNMVQSHAIEGVQHSKLTLDLMRLYHSFQYIAHSQRLAIASKVVGHRKNGAQVIGGVSPFCCEEAVIEVQPTNLRANVEGSSNRINLIIRSWYFRACGVCQ